VAGQLSGSGVVPKIERSWAHVLNTSNSGCEFEPLSLRVGRSINRMAKSSSEAKQIAVVGG